jgi:hypothetical protein
MVSDEILAKYGWEINDVKYPRTGSRGVYWEKDNYFLGETFHKFLVIMVKDVCKHEHCLDSSNGQIFVGHINDEESFVMLQRMLGIPMTTEKTILDEFRNSGTFYAHARTKEGEDIYPNTAKAKDNEKRTDDSDPFDTEF